MKATLFIISNFIILSTCIAQTWEGTTTPTTTSGYNTSIQLAHIGWGSHQGILFNANSRTILNDGSLYDNGNLLHRYDAGVHTSGAGGILFLGNGGRMDFIITESSPGAGQAIGSGAIRMTLNRNGHLGIGTIEPSNLLHIRKAESGWLQNIQGQAFVPGEFIGLKLTSGYLNETNKWAGVAAVATDQHSNNTSLALYASTTEKVRIDGNTGYVGIGTSSPEVRLHIADGGFRHGGTGEINIDAPGVIGGRFKILNDGYVGIGTTNPDAKLAVKGTVHAEEVKVDLQVPGPDYVFEPTYQLPSLTEIENYIKANKHLPEVPSAKEMETNGINLSEMNMLLLKKVEELTLYLIGQQNQINKQQEQLSKQQNQIQKLLTKSN